MPSRHAAVRSIGRIGLSSVMAVSLWHPAAHALDVAECKALEDDAKRLACYDAASGRTLPVEPAANARGARTADASVAPLADTTKPGTKASSLGERWDLDGGPNPSLFALRPYKPVYILPAFYSTSPNLHPTSPNPLNDAELRPLDHVEAKFQLSLKTKLLDDLAVTSGSLWFGYTQTSRWQVYNNASSRPFRETDYEPELMYTAPTNYSLGGLDGRLVGLSLTHQSNGRDLPQSRSWNRVIAQVGLETPSGDWTVMVRPWLRLREEAARDDNPDILDYVGRGEVIVIRKLGNQQIAVTLRHSLRAGHESRGSATVDWAFPVYGYLKGHVQGFSGYGESLIDYNHHQNAIGVGLSLEEWF